MCSPQQSLAQIWIEDPQRALQLDMAWNDVRRCSAMDATDGQHRGFHRRRLARDQRLQCDDQLGAGQNGIRNLVRHGAVAAAALEVDDERIRGRVDWSWPRVDSADLDLIPQVQPETRVRFGIQSSIADHSGRSIDAFLGGLKDEAHATAKIVLAVGQQLGHAQQDRRVPVVSTGVMHPCLFRSIGLASLGFDQRQSIHVGPQQ